MSAFLIYVDESYNDDIFCLSGLLLKSDHWREAFQMVKDHRAQLKADHGVLLRKEIHARDLVAGRGRLGPKDIGKWQRSRIFHGLLGLVARLPKVRLFNVALPFKGEADPQLKAWDRLLNRIDRTLRDVEEREADVRRRILQVVQSHASKDLADSAELRLAYSAQAIVIADEGRDVEITRVFRKMSVHNPIPSDRGTWPDGGSFRNTPMRRIIEDPVFRDSSSSYMLQLVDCVAFALLKREVPPTANISRYGINTMFEEQLAGICLKAASRTDPLGIVRK